MPTIIKAKKEESTDSVIRRFKKRMLTDNTLTLLKEKEFYLKPALKRKEQAKEVERRLYRDRMLAQRASKKGKVGKKGKK